MQLLSSLTTAYRSFAIADHTFQAVEGAEFPGGPAGIDGYVGFGLLDRYVVGFDYPKAEMRLYSPDDSRVLDEECGAAHFDLSIDGNVVTSTLRTDKGPLLVAWDTGATANVARPSRAPAPGRRAFWPWNPRILEVSDARLGGQSVGPLEFQMVEFTEPDVSGFLGYDFFRSKVVCLDFSRKKGGVRGSDFQQQVQPTARSRLEVP